MTTRTCQLPGCDEPFEPYRDWQKFCCPDHRYAWHGGRVSRLRRLAADARDTLDEILDQLSDDREASDEDHA